MTKKRALVAIPLAVLAAVAVLVLALGRGTGFDSMERGSSGGRAERSVSENDGPAPARGAGRGQLISDSRRVTDVDPLTRTVISTGQITLHTSKVSRARAEVERLVSSWNGTVANEQSSTDRRGRMRDTTMTLRVPTTKFSEAMTALEGLGRVEQVSTKSEDVTTQVIDNDARVRAAERSIRQIERLLSRAHDLGDIIAIESELARRQADLDSLKSQQAWLRDQTSLSTINVYVSRSGSGGPGDPDDRGFLAGLHGGWTALQGATVLALTAVGAMIPFAVLVLVLGVPLWLVVRRRSSRLSAGSAPARSA